MFPFDPATLPQLTTRKALLAIDFQAAFTSSDASLPVTEPPGFVRRAAGLADSFRPYGDVIWVQSRFDQPRPADPDQIIVTDEPAPTQNPSSRGRRGASPAASTEVDSLDEEAFLSHAGGGGLTPGAEGSEMSTEMKQVMAKGDATLLKSHYSAFQDTQLLHLLRAKMVMEVVICGSLANIGVYATAMDAAMHGMSITVVEDCCGYRSEARQSRSVDSLIKLTGCDIATADEALESMRPTKTAPKATASKDQAGTQAELESSVPATGNGNGPSATRVSTSPDIVNPMTGLRLASESPAPAAEASKTELKTGRDSAQNNISILDAMQGHMLRESLAGGNLAKRNGMGMMTTHNANGHGKALESDAERDGKVNGGSSEDVTTPSSRTIPSSNIQTSPLAKPPSPSDRMKTPTSPSSSISKHAKDAPVPTLCEGDTTIHPNLLPVPLSTTIYDTLLTEIAWHRMSHQGGPVPRLVAVQGSVSTDGDGSVPVYRHPSDEAPALRPFSPGVLAVKAEAERVLGHELNHVLVQYYRGGGDYISEHSDKTLDIVPGSFIANVSLGAERTMVLRTKRLDKDPSRTSNDDTASASTSSHNVQAVSDSKQRQTQRARLPHNSLLKMGLQTNMKWLHAIRQDKRADRDKTPEELSHSGGRISLTFRLIGTFLSGDGTTIWGQGGTGKTAGEAAGVVNGQTEQAAAMLRAFGTENHASEFDWDAVYGGGFDVLHMGCSPRLIVGDAVGGRDRVAELRVALMLAEYGVSHVRESVACSSTQATGSDGTETHTAPTKFIDNDESKATVQGDVAIMLYLWNRHGENSKTALSPSSTNNLSSLARQLTRFQQALTPPPQLRQLSHPISPSTRREYLQLWEGYATEQDGGGGAYIGGPELDLADFAFWPVLHYLVVGEGGVQGESDLLEGLDGLRRYYDLVRGRDCVGMVLERMKGGKAGKHS